jgi:hypothetical protein
MQVASRHVLASALINISLVSSLLLLSKISVFLLACLPFTCKTRMLPIKILRCSLAFDYMGGSSESDLPLNKFKINNNLNFQRTFGHMKGHRSKTKPNLKAKQKASPFFSPI